MENINKPSKEDIIEYYINQNHTIKECSEYFQISWDSMSRTIKKYNIIKDTSQRNSTEEQLKQKRLQQLVESVGTKEQVFNYYIVDNHNIKECQQYFHVCKDTFLKVLRYYKIAKSCNGGIRNDDLILKHQTPWKITCETLRDLYIEQNLSEEEIAQQYEISVAAVSKKLKQFQILKDSEQQQTKRQSTCLKKYGTNNPMQSSAICIQVKNNNLLKYGVEYPLQLAEIISKREQTLQDRYGVTNISTYLTQQEVQHYDIWCDADKFRQFLIAHDTLYTGHELSEFFKVGYASVLRKIHQYHLENFIQMFPNRSRYEDEIIQILLKEFSITNIETNCRNLLPSGKEIDIYLPEYKIGVEFNGDYWHSDIQESFQDHGGRSRYHQNKSLEAEEQGIFLFHIFEHEWDQDWTDQNPKFKNSRENILNRLRTILTKVSKRIPARLCEVREVAKEDKNLFLERNHIQGSDRAGSYILGLYYQNQLVSCMCFGHSKYEKYNYELTRFATVHDTVVQGGASKLFKYFVEHKLQLGENIVSYNDITKTKGDIYKILGFECTSINDPNYWWVNFDTLEVRSRYQEQEAGEVERMHSQGYHRICDCGTRTWVYTKK